METIGRSHDATPETLEPKALGETGVPQAPKVHSVWFRVEGFGFRG